MTTTCEATAAPVAFSIGDEQFLMAPLSELDYAELERWLQYRVIHLARGSLGPDVDAEMQRVTMEAAINLASSLVWHSAEGLKATRTHEGTVQYLWLALRHNQPNITIARVKSLIADKANKLAMVDAFNLANGFSAKKNEPAPPLENAPAGQ